MCSRIAVCSSVAVARRSTVGIRRLLHNSKGWNGTSNIAQLQLQQQQQQQYSAARRKCPPDINLTTAIPRNGSLVRERGSPARGLVLVGRTFSSLPKPSSSTAVTTTTKLAVEGGVMTISLPLPGLPGLTDVSVPLDVPVREFVSELMRLDESLSRVDIANADGNKVAACTAMQDVATRGFLISLGGRSRIRVLSEGIGERVIEVPAPEAYALLQAHIVRAGRVTLTRAELDDLCAKVHRKADPENAQKTLDPALADGWLQCLVDDGLVFEAGKGQEVLLNPSGRGVSEEIARALRRDDELIDLKVSRLREQLKDMYLEDARQLAIKENLIAKAQRIVTLKKSAVLAFMTAQFGTLAYCVYEVYSWDVMEPFTYFLMLSYSVGSSLYFSGYNREASFGNLEDVALRRSEAKLKSAHGYSRSEHGALKSNIKRHEDAVELLSSHRDAHPPLEPSTTNIAAAAALGSHEALRA